MLYFFSAIKYNPIIKQIPSGKRKDTTIMKKMLTLVLALLLVMTTLAACGASSTDSDLAYIQEKGKLIVGITDYAPMDY